MAVGTAAGRSATAVVGVNGAGTERIVTYHIFSCASALMWMRGTYIDPIWRYMICASI